MNLLDMLDQLEAGIAELRERASNGEQPSSRKTKPRRKKGSTKKAQRKQRASVPLSPAETEEKPSDHGPRLVGKRQALGRSLLQLRRGHGDTPGPH